VTDVVVLVAHARDESAADRVALADRLRLEPRPGTVLVQTCHRVELWATEPGVAPRAADGTRLLRGLDAARHVISVAAGLDSAVPGEDQVLHQVRAAVREARARGPLGPSLDHLVDLALRTGRRARSWLPARRRDLAVRALDLVRDRRGTLGDRVLVVGAGAMGARAVTALHEAGVAVDVASRTKTSAERLARTTGARALPFDPGADALRERSGVVVALAGPWPLSDGSVDALRDSGAWVVDLSAPPSVPGPLAGALGDRFLSVDDLARAPLGALDIALRERLERLVGAAVLEYAAWARSDSQRLAARTLSDHARVARDRELEKLWEQLPSLGASERAAVERMAERLAGRLLRSPLERLRQDRDGRFDRAARELFDL
jgi:glutamyl-tRNA reductase